MTIPVLETLRAHHSDSYGWALACCCWESAMAEDVLQEAYLRTLDGRATYAGKSSHKTWFFAVLKRVAADMYRTRKRASAIELQLVENAQATDPDGSGTTTPDTSELVQQCESSRQLREALMQLPQRQREVLHLAFYADFTIEDVARTLGITVGSARTHYHRGKSRLAELLEYTNVTE